MLRIYLPSSTDLKLCSDVPIVNFVNTWTFITVFTSRYLKYELAGMKMRGWKCKDESARMKVRGWKCEDENAGMKMPGMKKPGDEKQGMKVKRWNVRGWSVTQPYWYILYYPTNFTFLHGCICREKSRLLYLLSVIGSSA